MRPERQQRQQWQNAICDSIMSVTTATMVGTAVRRMRSELHVFIACVAFCSSNNDFALGDLELLDSDTAIPCDTTNVLGNASWRMRGRWESRLARWKSHLGYQKSHFGGCVEDGNRVLEEGNRVLDVGNCVLDDW